MFCRFTNSNEFPLKDSKIHAVRRFSDDLLVKSCFSIYYFPAKDAESLSYRELCSYGAYFFITLKVESRKSSIVYFRPDFFSSEVTSARISFLISKGIVSPTPPNST